MRREFILIMLGIVSISTITSVYEALLPVPKKRVLLDTIVGVIGAGNYSYWHFGYYGPLIIELTSRTGDADIYVDFQVTPSADLDSHVLSSTTCGLDVVYLPSDFYRPFSFAIFGHWSSEVTEYIVHIYLDTSGNLTDLEKRSLSRKHHYHIESPLTEAEAKELGAAYTRDSRMTRISKLFGIFDTLFEVIML